MGKGRSSGFVQGAFFLSIAVIISKLLGVVYVAPLQNLLGNQGMGLYNIAFPLYTMMLTISTAGFPLAMSKSIASRLALGQTSYVRHTFSVASKLLMITGLVFFVCTWIFAPVYAHISGNPSATLAIRAIAPSLLIVPLLSAYRGYLQGHQQMLPSGLSQIIEQIGRVSAIVIGAALVLRLTRGDFHMAAAAATFGGFVGAACSLLYLVFSVKGKTNLHVRPSPMNAQIQSTKTIIFELAHYGFPISLGALVLPIANQVDVLTIINLLKMVGISTATATGELGILGNSIRLLQIPLGFATAMGISLLPAITEANTLGDKRKLDERITVAFRLNSIVTLGAGAVFLTLAKPIYVSLFKDSDGVAIIESLSIMGVFSSCELVTTYMLQGIGRYYQPVGHMFIGVASKLVLNIALVPIYGIRGAAFATIFGYILSSSLNIAAVLRHTRIRPPADLIIWKPIVASLILGAAMLLSRLAATAVFAPIQAIRLQSAIVTVIVMLIGAPVYLIALLFVGAIKANELAALPVMGNTLVRLCSRNEKSF